MQYDRLNIELNCSCTGVHAVVR